MAATTQQTIEVENSGINFTMPSGMIMADSAVVRDHLVSHSRAVERAALAAHGQAVAGMEEIVEKKQGVPQEVLKAMASVAFKDAIARRNEEDGGNAEGEVEGGREDVDPKEETDETGSESVASTCCRGGACAAPGAKAIFGLQVDNEDEDRVCEICQSGYCEDDEVAPLAPSSSRSTTRVPITINPHSTKYLPPLVLGTSISPLL